MTEQHQKLWTKDFINITLINVLLFLGWQMQLATLPIHLIALTGQNTIVGLCTAAGTVTALISRPVSGYMLDRFGRRGIFFVGMIIMVAATLLYSWFPVAAVVIGIRLVHGFGWGASTTSSNTIATDVIPHSRFGEGMGFFTVSQSLSLSLAPVIGLAVMNAFGYRVMTFTAAGMLFIPLIMAFFLNYRKPEAIKKKKFAPYERSAVRPSIIMVFVGIAVGSVFGFAAVYGNKMNFGNSALFFSVYAVSLLVVRPIIGKVIDRYGTNLVIYPGFAVLIVSFVILFSAQSMWAFLAAAFVQGMSYGTVQTSLQTMAVVNAAPDRRGAANATFFTGFDLGIGIGNLGGGAIADALGYGQMYLIMTAPLIVGAALYYFIAHRHQARLARENAQAPALIDETIKA